MVPLLEASVTQTSAGPATCELINPFMGPDYCADVGFKFKTGLEWVLIWIKGQSIAEITWRYIPKLNPTQSLDLVVISRNPRLWATTAWWTHSLGSLKRWVDVFMGQRSGTRAKCTGSLKCANLCPARSKARQNGAQILVALPHECLVFSVLASPSRVVTPAVFGF